jgi:hypothetical protein
MAPSHQASRGRIERAAAATATDTTNAVERLMPASMGPALDASGGTAPGSFT